LRLPDDCQERTIGVILSGMGSDGGLKAIKGKTGDARKEGIEETGLNA